MHFFRLNAIFSLLISFGMAHAQPISFAPEDTTPCIHLKTSHSFGLGTIRLSQLPQTPDLNNSSAYIYRYTPENFPQWELKKVYSLKDILKKSITFDCAGSDGADEYRLFIVSYNPDLKKWEACDPASIVNRAITHKKFSFKAFHAPSDFDIRHDYTASAMVPIAAATTVLAMSYVAYKLYSKPDRAAAIQKVAKNIDEYILGKDKQAHTMPPNAWATNIISEDGQGNTIITNPETNKNFSMGTMVRYSLGFLRRKTQSIDNSHKGPFSGTLRIVTGSVDDYQIQNPDSIFQVASGHNALELVLPTDRVEKKTLCGLIYDRTQGPIACISAYPAYLQRMFLAFRLYAKNGVPYDNRGQSPGTWRQKNDTLDQINLLENVSDYYPVTNGYTDFTPESLNNNWKNADHSDKFQILYHKNIDVIGNFTNKDRTYFKFVEPPVRIHQAYTAAANLGDGCNPHTIGDSRIQTRAVDLLNNNYELIIRTAIFEGKNNVFLTLLGGGVFGNSMKKILAAITKQKSLIKQAGLHVRLVAYDDRTANDIKRICPSFEDMNTVK